ncbi:MAG TPA: hypothetical protein VE825_01490 [Terriglobales bacterium]|jgi:hypothetical protein|nr:hypothetical protein [Terriglobales bacterium]
MSEFEERVLTELSEVKSNVAEVRAHLRWLLGNGNSGLIAQLEERVARHEAYVQKAAGVGTVLAVLLTVVHLALDYLRR